MIMNLRIKNFLLIFAGMICGLALASKSAFASAVPVLILNTSSFYGVSPRITIAVVMTLVIIAILCCLRYLMSHGRLEDKQHEI